MLTIQANRRGHHGMSVDVLAHTAAGMSAGALSTACCHPIDSLKTRYQALDPHLARHLGATTYSSSLQAVRAIYRTEGVLAFYQGMAPALLGSASAWGLYFGCYQYLRGMLPETLPARNFLAASVAGAVGTVLTSPFWVVKTRMQLYERSVSRPTMLSELRLILRTAGPVGLFRGLGPQLWLVLNPSIQLTIYEHLKSWCHRWLGGDAQGQLPNSALTGCIVASKTVATVLTTPLSVIKVRMQDPRGAALGPERYGTMLRSAATIYACDGARGFFKGLVPTLAKPLPASLVTFLTYEQVSHFLKARLCT